MLNKNVMEALDVFVMGILFFYIANEVKFSIQRRKLSFTFLFVYSILCTISYNKHSYERKIQQTEEI